jgi:hypothetical protein
MKDLAVQNPGNEPSLLVRVLMPRFSIPLFPRSVSAGPEDVPFGSFFMPVTALNLYCLLMTACGFGRCFGRQLFFRVSGQPSQCLQRPL